MKKGERIRGQKNAAVNAKKSRRPTFGLGKSPEKKKTGRKKKRREVIQKRGGGGHRTGQLLRKGKGMAACVQKKRKTL